MDLRNNRITLGELFADEKAKRIVERNFPVLRNHFLLTVALKMSLENTLKLATGPSAQLQVEKMLSDLNRV